MSEETGLVAAFRLDGEGGGRQLDWAALGRWKPMLGTLWVHFDYEAEDAQRWLHEESGLDAITLAALLARDPRPRSVASGDGLLLIVRGVNENAGAEPEDMVSLRVWCDETRVITLRHRRFAATEEVRRTLAEGNGPRDPGDFLTDLLGHVLTGIGGTVDQLDDQIHGLEDEVLSAERHELRRDLAHSRRQAIALRRYIGPQRDVLARLQSEKASWLSELDRTRLREAADRLTRMVEDLDASRDQAAVTQEELSSRLSEQMNQRLYVLSLLSAVFMPLGFATGALGVNLGGVPGLNEPTAFWWMAGIMIVIGVVQGVVFRYLKWI